MQNMQRLVVKGLSTKHQEGKASGMDIEIMGNDRRNEVLLVQRASSFQTQSTITRT
jgi:hypothetical protein